jgi:Domain of Unknown Function (DUF1080)
LRKLVFVGLALFLLGAIHTFAAGGAGFVSIFDGKTLDGWSTADMSYWSVEDGALTGTVSAEHPNPYSRWIVWQGSQVGDFELKLKFRILGTVDANSGLQFRSTYDKDQTHAHGYQADLVRDPKWMGLLYEEGSVRKILAHRGEKTIFDEAGNRDTKQFADAEMLFSVFKLDNWNEYRVVAHGNDIKAFINGRLMSEVVDNDKKFLQTTGWIGLQLHHGPPMKVQFKDILLKKYR